MRSFIFHFNQETLSSYDDRIRAGEEVPLAYIAGANRLPFANFLPGDQVFIVGVNGGAVRLAGRMIVGQAPISHAEAIRRTGRSDFFPKELICFADPTRPDSIRPNITIPPTALAALELFKNDGTPVDTRSLINGKPAVQVFMSKPSLSDESAKMLSSLLGFAADEYDGTAPELMPNALETDVQVDDDAYRMRAIKSRRGQPQFRKNLMTAYRKRCVVSGCAIHEILEAAHIAPHADLTDYRVSNGLLLRADIHTLFDENLLAISDSYRVVVSPLILEQAYRQYDGKSIHLPDKTNDQPSRDSLKARMARLRQPLA